MKKNYIITFGIDLKQVQLEAIERRCGIQKQAAYSDVSLYAADLFFNHDFCC